MASVLRGGRWVLLPIAVFAFVYAWVVLLPLLIVGAGAMVAWDAVARRVADRRLRRRLARAGRTARWEEVEAFLARDGGAGTLIVESPTLGWNVARAWWAPGGEALRGAPAPPRPGEVDGPDFEPEGRHPFSVWCARLLAGEEGGAGDGGGGGARLVDCAYGARACRRLEARVGALRERYPGLGRVDLWSAAVEAVREMDRRETAQPPRESPSA